MNVEQSSDAAHDSVDQMLQEWSRNTAPSDEHLDALTHSIVEAVARSSGESTSDRPIRGGAVEHKSPGDPIEHKSPGDPIEHKSPSDSTIRAVAVRALALAACLALMVSYLAQPGFWSTPRQSGLANSDESQIPENASLDSSRLVEKAALLQEMERVFDGQFQWMVETEDQVKVGTATNTVAVTSQPLLVRLVVQRRESPGSVWAPAYTVDVVTRSEQVIAVEQVAGELDLSMWAYALPDGMIALDAQIRAGDLQTSTSEILSDGQPKKTSAIPSNGSEYRVFQTAVALNGPVS